MNPLKCFIASNPYGTYCVPGSSKHRPAAAAILRGDVWEPQTIALLIAHCARGDIIHAGTYFGDFLPALSKALSDGARVWAFEPSAENFRCATITLELNDIRNVVLTNAALGTYAGTAILRIGEIGRRPVGGGSTIAASRQPGFLYEDVPVVAVDQMVPGDRQVSVLQLDVERYEQQALMGALSTIRRCLPLLVLENLPADPQWFAQNILSLGYEGTEVIDKNQVFRAR